MELWQVTIDDEKFVFNDEVIAKMFAADLNHFSIEQITVYEDLESAFAIADLVA